MTCYFALKYCIATGGDSQPPSQPPPPGTVKDDLAAAFGSGDYPSGEQHVAALLTVAGEMHLVQGGPNFLQPPDAS